MSGERKPPIDDPSGAGRKFVEDVTRTECLEFLSPTREEKPLRRSIGGVPHCIESWRSPLKSIGGRTTRYRHQKAI